MTKTLSDYQRATLQAMGIPVWIETGGEAVSDGDSRVSIVSEEWQRQNQSFINDLLIALSTVVPQQFIDQIEWCHNDDET